MTTSQRQQLLRGISERLVTVYREAQKAFQVWRNARSQRHLAEPELQAYLKLNRRCQLLQRAERRLTR